MYDYEKELRERRTFDVRDHIEYVIITYTFDFVYGYVPDWEMDDEDEREELYEVIFSDDKPYDKDVDSMTEYYVDKLMLKKEWDLKYKNELEMTIHEYVNNTILKDPEIIRLKEEHHAD